MSRSLASCASTWLDMASSPHVTTIDSRNAHPIALHSCYTRTPRYVRRRPHRRKPSTTAQHREQRFGRPHVRTRVTVTVCRPRRDAPAIEGMISGRCAAMRPEPPGLTMSSASRRRWRNVSRCAMRRPDDLESWRGSHASRRWDDSERSRQTEPSKPRRRKLLRVRRAVSRLMTTFQERPPLAVVRRTANCAPIDSADIKRPGDDGDRRVPRHESMSGVVT